MKIICDSDVLSESINIVSKAVSGRTTLPILECVLLTAVKDTGNGGGGFRLMGTDLELGIETKTVEARVLEEGAIALSAGMFFDIARKLPGDEAFIETLENNVVIIRSGGSEFKVLGYSADEFPTLPEVERDSGFDVPSAELKNMIRQTIFSVSADESKPVMTGELFSVENGSLKVTATDGFRIAVRSQEIMSGESGFTVSAVIPGKTLGEISKILSQNEKSVTNIFFSEKYAMFETENAVIVSRLIDGKFPEFEKFFQTESTTFASVDREVLLNALERASLIARETKKSPVKLTFDGNTLNISSNTEAGTFIEELPVEIDGVGIEITFNPRYIIDILKVMEDKKISLEFTSPLIPCIIKGAERADYRFIIVPLRIKA